MQLGPIFVIACPACGHQAKVSVPESGNTFGARIWTDGRMQAPMMSMPPAITRCVGCGKFYWTEDANEVGVIEPGERTPPEWRDLEPIRELSEDELLQALDMGMARDLDEELVLRIQTWWAGNDPYRQAMPGVEPPPHVFSPAARQNLERLMAILDEGEPDQRVMKAEAARELGHFNEATHLLQNGLPEEYETVVDLIRRYSLQKNPRVAEIIRES